MATDPTVKKLQDKIKRLEKKLSGLSFRLTGVTEYADLCELENVYFRRLLIEKYGVHFEMIDMLLESLEPPDKDHAMMRDGRVLPLRNPRNKARTDLSPKQKKGDLTSPNPLGGLAVVISLSDKRK